DLRDRRLAMQHVLDSLPVDLVVRNSDDVRIGLGQGEYTLGELVDRDALRRAHVVDLARQLARVHQAGERADRVLHVAEAARLRAVAVDRDRLAGEAPGGDAGGLEGGRPVVGPYIRLLSSSRASGSRRSP